MQKYEAMRTFQAECEWRFQAGSQNAVEVSRKLVYERPNKWHATSAVKQGPQVASVSDGTRFIENVPGAGTTQDSGRPDPIWESDTKLMRHPMFCGTPLYQFFGGPARFSSLVDTKAGQVEFGTDVKVNGVPCRTVTFAAADKNFGKVEIAIGVTDGLVHRIAFDSSGVPGAPGNVKVTETYSKVAVDKGVPAGEFAVTLPNAPDITVTDPQTNRKVMLSSMRGKVVLLDFWATWCESCRQAMPENQKMYDELRARGFTVMALSDEPNEKIVAFATENRYTLPFYHDEGDKAFLAYHVTSIPATFVIDKQGKVAASFVGASPEQVREAIQQAGVQ